jgi:hypothetical protein
MRWVEYAAIFAEMRNIDIQNFDRKIWKEETIWETKALFAFNPLNSSVTYV